MNPSESIEIFYRYLNLCSEKYSKRFKKPYLEALNETLNYLLDDQVHFQDETLLSFFKESKETITNTEFDKETIRKSIQLALLRGFKYDEITNAQMTPDTIGIFLSYLVKKLYQNKEIKLVLDPLIGTGNLIASVANHIDQSFEVHGIDDDALMCALSRNMFDALEMKHQIFHQDTLTFQMAPYDLIITDFPPKNVTLKSGYLPYYTIVHHLENLQRESFYIALIENDFFDQKDAQTFQKILKDKAHLFGLIKLDEGLFKTHPKSLLILKKKKHPEEKLDDFLMVDLPSFTDREAFNKALYKMDQWFKKKEVDVQ